MRILLFLTISLVFLLCGCGSTPSKTPETVAVTGNPPPRDKTTGFQVSKEKFETSFKDIQSLILKLNGIIAEKKIQEWKTYLDESYIQANSDPIRLREYSLNSPVLKQYNIKLKTLNDYFDFVVVPSRSNAKLDDISFLDEERVEAFMVIKNEKVLLYQLKLYGKEWKISYW